MLPYRKLNTSRKPKTKQQTHTHTVPYLESAKTAAWLNYARKSLPKKIAK